MKASLALRGFLLSSLFLGVGNSAKAQSTYFWDANGGTSGTGGNGIWNTGSSLWRSGTSTGTLSLWPNTDPAADTAQFAGTVGKVTLNTSSVNINVNKIIFGTTGYEIAGPASGTATLNLSGTTPTIDMGNSISATISAKISGSTGLTKTGAGSLTLSGANTYSGTTAINGGTLIISGNHSGATGGWTINSGATSLSFAAGSTISVGAGNNVTTVNGGGSGGRSLSVAGTVTTSATSSLTIRGRNAVTINNGGSWTMQGGTLTIQPQNTTYSATLTVNTGGSFTYSGTNTIVLTEATTGNDGNGTLNLAGGTFTTTRGISNSGGGNGDGASNFNFSAGGTLKISNDITSIFTQGSQPFNITTGTGGGVIDTNTFNTATSLGISGTGGLEKKSAGTLTLAGTNTYTGTTTISGGTLQLGTGGATGALTATTGITNNGNLTINRNNAFTQATDLNGQAITGSGSFTQAGSGTTTLTGSNTYTGDTTVNSGTLVVGGGSLANTAITVNNAGSAFAVRPGAGTINLGTTGTGTAGASLTLASGTSFSMVDGDIGTVNLQQQDSFASSGLTLSGGASLNFEVGAATADRLVVTKGAAVSGNSSINVLGQGSMAGSYDLITAASGLDGGTYTFGGSGTSAQTLAIGTNAYGLTLGSSATAVTLTVASTTPISGVTWTGQTNGDGAANSIWDNAFSTNWAANTSASAVGNGTAVTFGDTNAANGDVAITNSTVTVAASGVSPTSTTFNNSSVNYTVGGGSIGGTGTLTKTGTGTVTLSGTNTYSGATTVSAGTLYVTGALSNSAVTVEAAATIASNGLSGVLGNGLTIEEGGSLDLTGATLGASSTGILRLTGGSLNLGNLTFQDLVGWDWLNAAPGTYEIIDGTFAINWGSTTFLSDETAYDFGNGKKGYFTSGSLNVVIVPEPRAALLGSLGLLALFRRRR